MKKTKFKILAFVMAVMCCMTAFSVTAFASDGTGCYESNEDGCDTPPSSIDSITISTKDATLPESQGSKPLTPDGNLSLIDDVYQVESYDSDESKLKDKQFIVVQSKSGNYFYIVIDRSGDTENVYFLNLVDETDLMALMADSGIGNTSTCTCTEKCVAGDVNTDCPVCKNNMSECTGKEAAVVTPKPDTGDDAGSNSTDETENGKSGSSSLILIVFMIAIAAGGALYWFKFRKNKLKTKGNADLDDYDYGEDEDDDDIEYETEPDDEEPAAGSGDEE